MSAASPSDYDWPNGTKLSAFSPDTDNETSTPTLLAEELVVSSDCITWAYLRSAAFMLLAVCLLAINLTVVLGNTLVVLAACTSAKLQHALTSTFVVSLALSDLLLGIAVLPFSTVHQVLLKRWIFGRRWCQLWLALDVWTCTASILNLVIISLDRYLSLCHPLKYPKLMNRRRARLMVAGVWLLASTISLPTLLKQQRLMLEASLEEGTIDNESYHGNMPCLNLGPTCSIAQSELGYTVYSALGSFFIPLLVVTYLYARICSVVHRTLRAGRSGTVIARERYGELRVHRGGGGGGVGAGGSLTRNSHANENSYNAGSNYNGSHATNTHLFAARYSRELKAARMLAIICVAFVGCWAPFFSVYLYGAICQDCVSPSTFDVCFWLGYLNSALNPFIYALFSADYRRAFKVLIGRLCGGGAGAGQHRGGDVGSIGVGVGRPRHTGTARVASTTTCTASLQQRGGGGFEETRA